jgi:phosphate transport system permease protein
MSDAPLKPPADMVKRWTIRRFMEGVIILILQMCALLSVLTTFGIIFVLLNESVLGIGTGKAFFSQINISRFFFTTEWDPQYDINLVGIWALISGTMLVTVIAASISLPIGLACAVYLSEYASPRLRAWLKPSLELLAGIPTVVYGYFALVFVTPYILKPIFGSHVDIFNALSAGIVVGFMIIPMVSSLSEDVLRSVPRGLREAGYALGSTRFDVSVKIIVPAALSGILASFILAISRAVGETMAVVIAAGQRPLFTLNPLTSIQTMTAYIASTSGGDTSHGSVEYQSIYGVALILFLITLTMNIISQWILSRFREVYN